MHRDPSRSEFDVAGLSDLELPPNVVLGRQSRVVADEVSRRAVFGRFRTKRTPGIVVGERSLIENVAFNLEENAQVMIGNDCELRACFLIAGEGILIGNGVTIGWHATIVDSDFHPIAPKDRRQDVLALSPASTSKQRQRILAKPVVIGDDVWIGPLAVVLKGVRIGNGAWIEPGAVIAHDVPAGARMLGNPAQRIEEVR
jgi:acetyltransferase-like isoleucine patch superfamily enzyme